MKGSLLVLTLAHEHTGAGAGVLHLLMLVIWVPALVVWRLLDRSAARPRALRWAAAVAAWSSIVAAMVHVVVTPEHLRESPLYGVFFVAAAAAQFVFAILVAWRPGATLFAAGLLGQLALVVLWLVTRTVGIPAGPQAGTIEEIGVLDSISVAAEVACALACLTAMVTLLHAHRSGPSVRVPVNGPAQHAAVNLPVRAE